jgi:hypothetical protein
MRSRTFFPAPLFHWFTFNNPFLTCVYAGLSRFGHHLWCGSVLTRLFLLLLIDSFLFIVQVIVVTLIYLVAYLGLAALVGVSVMLGSLGISALISRWMGVLQSVRHNSAQHNRRVGKVGSDFCS